MAKLVSILLFAITSLQAASATPVDTRADVPEVVPGTGMPSLESLGLTSKDLYAMGKPSAPTGLHVLSAQFDARCGPQDEAYGPVSGVIACYNYLNSLGTRNCQVQGSAVVQFCRSGASQAIGQSLTGNPESSYCRDVATGLLWVINHCTRPQQDVAGFQAPAGNGNFFVGGVSINW